MPSAQTSTTDLNFILQSVQCYCGKTKPMSKPFCYQCFALFPAHIQTFVRYIRNDNFRGTYDAAVEYLENLKEHQPCL